MTSPPIVVVGASAGGVEALRQMVAGLTLELAAAVFIVLHTPPHGPGALPTILRRSGPLPVDFGGHGDPIKPGTIAVAPPNHHLLVREDHIELTRDPKENGFRPAADASLRSAAHSHGRMVVGVVLSGTLDDGTAGLLSVRHHGGRVVVQDPSDALYEGMPRNALAQVAADHVLPAAKIGPLLVALAEELAAIGRAKPNHNPNGEPETGGPPLSSTPSAFSCPDCHGVLWETSESGMLRFRCRIGHVWSPNSLIAEQDESVENALWIAVRALEERAGLYDQIRHRAQQGGHKITAAHFEERAAEAAHGAASIRRLITATQATTLS